MGEKKLSSVVIPICLIQVWDHSDSNGFAKDPDSPTMTITEVESIEISDSYKNLFNTAEIRFPKGTLVRTIQTKAEIGQSEDDGEEGNNEVTANVDDTGIIVTKRVQTNRALPTSFKIGQRIRVRLGYTTDPSIAASGKTNNHKNSIFMNSQAMAVYKDSMKIMFDGFITKIGIEEPIVLRCEDLASVLKKINCPKINPSKNLTVNDLFASDGKYKLLKNSCLKLHPDTKNSNIDIGITPIPGNLTIADVLLSWAKNVRLYSFIKTGPNEEPCLAIGRAYFDKIEKDTVFYDDDHAIREINFNWHVANNGLTLLETNKNFLAIEATSLENIGGKEKFYHITVRRNPEWSPDGKMEKYQILNEVSISKKSQKCGATVLGKSKDKVDLSTYTILPYMSRKINISHEDLKREVIKYYESVNMNGIEGDLTLFGDLALKSAMKVHLNDPLRPGKNGYYLIDEVVTTFSATGGYRQKIKLPYCISRDKNE